MGETLEERLLLSAWVATDNADYSPGETAVINAGGFAIGETVALNIQHADGTHASDPAHQTFYIKDGGAGDLDGAANGRIETTWYVGNGERDAALNLVATGMTSHWTAAYQFFDSSQLGSVSVGEQVGTLTYGTGGSVTYLVTVNRGEDAGAFSVDLSLATALPAGVTATFGTNTLDFTETDNSLSTIVTLTSSDSSQASGSPFAFTVQATLAGNEADFTTADGALAIDRKVLTGSITADGKTYDGNTGATIATRSLSGVVEGDDVSYTGGTATFADKNAETGKTVTAVGLALSGADADNYTVNDSATTTADISQLAISGSITAEDKQYDGTTDATIATATLTGAISGDDVSYGGGTATFADKNIGTKLVTATGMTLSGADAANYTVNDTAVTTAVINARVLVGTIVVDDKTYDGTTDATISQRSLTGVVSGEDVSYAGGTAAFADKNAGDAKSVSASGLFLTGSDIANYTVNDTATTTATISPLALTGAITADDKTYDGTTAATIASATATGVLSGDDVTYGAGTATFDTKNVGTGKTVTASGMTLSGADAANYSVSDTATTTASISALALTGSITAANKTYDGTTNATISNRNLAGAVSGDDVSYTGGSASFDDKNAGTGKSVTATGLALSGADAGNYTVNSTATATADISQALLTVKADNKSINIGQSIPTLTASYSGFVNNETLDTSGVTGSPELGTTADSTSPSGSYPITVGQGSLAASNYSFQYVNGTLTISQVATTTTLSVSSPVRYGGDSTFTATISPASSGGQAPATGVQFYLDGKAIGTVQTLTQNGDVLSASLTIVVVASKGDHTVTAQFIGVNSGFSVSDPSSQTLTVKNNGPCGGEDWTGGRWWWRRSFRHWHHR